ncbi:MAG TPA: V-type ATP synthase subunit D [Steroidobacteraceae bacterium]|nr:V-type ATP synthase subunit D [Steroidobacteraceae bacterium]
MAESRREVPTTRIAMLELRDEQRLVQEGYSLLDEKRILLATEIQRELARLRERSSGMAAAQDAARGALSAALLREGLDALAVHPPESLAAVTLGVVRSRLLGLQLIEASLQDARSSAARPVQESGGEAIAECVRTQRTVLAAAVALASCCLNLRRLMREYVRTERRTRAIENILLPELNSALQQLEEQLDGLDQEEFARLRQQRERRSRPAGERGAGSS